jgi:hypothetical protein
MAALTWAGRTPSSMAMRCSIGGSMDAALQQNWVVDYAQSDWKITTSVRMV